MGHGNEGMNVVARAFSGESGSDFRESVLGVVMAGDGEGEARTISHTRRPCIRSDLNPRGSCFVASMCGTFQATESSRSV